MSIPVSEWLDLMADTVTVAPYSSQNKYGESTYGAAVSYRARVQGRNQIVTTANGEEKASTVTVYLGSVPATITPRDLLTLPSRYSPTTPPILAIGHQTDELGAHHVVVYC